ncbi:hypothetical protein [Mesorhizobium sp. CAU 1732]|uniref:hypothetical protein n=1 Tax=Mesorhizobium sp. CAU 1732 TaxID=3140358 RepID=UPI003261B175
MGIANKDRATFSIDSAVKQSLEDRVPKSRRSAFVEQAIADALRKEAVAHLKNTLDDIRASSVVGEDSVDLIRRLRDERGAYIAHRHGPRV